MDIEKNIILFHPLNPLLEELKKELENDSSVTLYEMDSYAEFGQVIGIFEKSISYFTDLKDVVHITKEFSTFVAGTEARLILINQRTLPPHILGKHKNNGLDKVYKANTPIEDLLGEINNFFSESNESNAEISGQKDFVIENKTPVKESTNLRVKSMAILEEKVSNVMVKSMILNDYAHAFNHYNRKKIKELNLEEFIPKLKKVNFKPFTPEVQPRKPQTYRESDLGGNMSNKSSFDLFERGMNKKEGKKKEEGEGLKRKKVVKFEEVEREKKKHKKFIEVDIEREREKQAELEEEDYKKKRKKFVEVEIERERPSLEKEDEEELKKKKHAQFEEVAIEREKNKAEKEDEEDLKKKKHAHFEEVAPEKEKNTAHLEQESDLNKKKAHFEEVSADLKKKKNNFKEVQREYDHKQLREDTAEKEKKPQKKFIEVEIEREQTHKEKEELKERGKKENLEIEELERDGFQVKKSEPKEINKKERAKFEEVSLESEKKKSNFKEENIQTHWGGKKNQTTEKDQRDNKNQTEIIKKEKKTAPEVILDYKKFKAQYKAGNLSDNEMDENEIKNQYAKKAMESEEIIYYRPKTDFLYDLMDFMELFLSFKHDALTLYKYIHMILYKKAESHLYIFNAEDQLIYPQEQRVEHTKIIKEALNCEKMTLIDNTFQSPDNYMYLPISVDDKVVAKILILISDNEMNHQIPFEGLAYLLRGSFL